MVTSNPSELATETVDSPVKIGVAHLLHTVAYGGPETIIINWLRAENRELFDVHLICFADKNGSEKPFVEAAEAAGLSIHFIPWNRGKPIIQSARKLSAYIRENRIDILHCYNTYAEFVGVVTKHMTGVRLLTTKWMWGKLDWKRAVLQKMERAILPQFDRVTAQSEFAAGLTPRSGGSRKQVEVLISGLEQPLYLYTKEERLAERRMLGASSDNLVFLHLARFWPEKAHNVLLRSFRLVVDHEDHARLWLAGVGPLLEPTKRLVCELSLEKHVRFIGFCSDLSKLLPLVDAQIHSSNMEGIPLALCSGLSAGLPVASTSVGGIPEIIEDGVTGLLVPPGDPEQLASAAISLVRDGDLRNRLGSAAKRFMEQHYSLNAAVRRLETLYSEMMTA